VRVLVTGSRDWEGIWAANRIHVILDFLHNFAQSIDTKLTIVNGACPTGADQIATRWAQRRADEGVDIEVFPADWQKYGKAAGPLRNEAMVQAGADLGLAFLRNGSSGTTHTINLARMAYIPMYVIFWEEEIP
jgi:hypothetical protein